MPSVRTQTFIAAFQSVRGITHVVSNWEEAAGRAAAICVEKRASCVALGDFQGTFNETFRQNTEGAIDTILSPPYSAASLPGAIDAVQIGVGFAAYGIAQTGTLVEEATDDAIRLVSALPRTYIGIVAASDLVENLIDAAPRLRASFAQHAENNTVSFISGPSRTGDIEMILTLGVHGPEEAHAIIVDNATSGSGSSGNGTRG